MVYHGTVKNGIVEFDEGATPEDGVRVIIQQVNGVEPPSQTSQGSLPERLLELAGTGGPGLPPDLARNHDHYLHGLPKR